MSMQRQGLRLSSAVWKPLTIRMTPRFFKKVRRYPGQTSGKPAISGFFFSVKQKNSPSEVRFSEGIRLLILMFLFGALCHAVISVQIMTLQTHVPELCPGTSTKLSFSASANRLNGHVVPECILERGLVS